MSPVLLQASLSLTQLLSRAETAPEATSAGRLSRPTGPLPASLSHSLDDVSFDCDCLDDMMWDELGDLGLEAAANPDMYANVVMKSATLPCCCCNITLAVCCD